MRILVTGGNGFIGHHLIEHLLKNTDYEIDIIDKLSYASMGYNRLIDVECYSDDRIRHFTHDFTQPIQEELFKVLDCPDFIVHMGAETHVDQSIVDPGKFVQANVVGTFQMLQFARQIPNLKRFIYFSTDEVFGPADKYEVPNGFNEWDRYKSSNPYAATKAGGEELCLAYHNTYKIPVIITHTMNVFGERQHPEKFIPMCINKILKGDKIIIHSDKTCTIPGSRYWIHARNVASAVLFLLFNGQDGDKYNIVGEREVNNLEMAQFISRILKHELHYEMVDFHTSRPGHDLRYALNGSKLLEMGHHHPKGFEESLSKTIQWTQDNPKWLNIK